jgi:hypothetical protein
MLTVASAALIAVVESYHVPTCEQMEETGDLISRVVDVHHARLDCTWYILLVRMGSGRQRQRFRLVAWVHGCVR